VRYNANNWRVCSFYNQPIAPHPHSRAKPSTSNRTGILAHKKLKSDKKNVVRGRNDHIQYCRRITFVLAGLLVCAHQVPRGSGGLVLQWVRWVFLLSFALWSTNGAGRDLSQMIGPDLNNRFRISSCTLKSLIKLFLAKISFPLPTYLTLFTTVVIGINYRERWGLKKKYNELRCWVLQTAVSNKLLKNFIAFQTFSKQFLKVSFYSPVMNDDSMQVFTLIFSKID
jgi:hypothetical protein